MCVITYDVMSGLLRQRNAQSARDVMNSLLRQRDARFTCDDAAILPTYGAML